MHVFPAAIAKAGIVFNLSVCLSVCVDKQKVVLETRLVVGTLLVVASMLAGVCMFDLLSQQHLVSMIALQPSEMQT